jgi:drug/metabolite transporter (DMT)-like permease
MSTHATGRPATGPVELTLDGTVWTLLIALSLLWGASFIFIKIAAVDIPIFTLVFLRVALAALALHAVIVVTGRAYPAGLAIYGRYGLMGLLNNAIPFVLIVYATPRIGAGAASILNATTPIFTLIVAHILTADEKITAAKAGGIALGFAGVVVMIGPKAFGGLSTEVLAALAMLGATLAYGFSAVVGRSFKSIDPVVSAACQLTASTLILAPLAFALETPWQLAMPGLPAIAATLGFALLSTALAYVLFFRIIMRAGGTNVMLATLLVPISAVALGVAFLGEVVSPADLGGMALISAGLIIIDGRVMRRLHRAPAT